MHALRKLKKKLEGQTEEAQAKVTSEARRQDP